MHRSLLLLLVPGLFLIGCGGDAKDKDRAAKKEMAKDRDKDKAQARDEVAQQEAARAPAAGQKQADGQKGVKKKAAPRKIIYTGQVEVVVSDFDKARQEMLDLLKENDGYVAGSMMTGEPGEPRYGRWTLRIPTGKFETFLDAIARLGELRQQTLDSEDVTDRYFDTKAEVTNLEAREEALRKLYKEKIAGSKLTDLIEVDRELNSVRGQINVRKGQLQRWDKLVEFATITLTLRDRKGYVPPTSPEFGTTVGRTFFGSIDALVWAAKGVVLVAVALAPWFAVLAVLTLAIWLPVRFFSRPQRKAAPLEALPAEPPPPADEERVRPE